MALSPTDPAPEPAPLILCRTDQRQISQWLQTLVLLLAAAGLAAQGSVAVEAVPGRWSVARAQAWYDAQPWLVGANYYPRTAINQIDMWQASTWDPATIREELTWAQGIGMNTMRVYLHDLVWADDEEGLYARMEEFLDICAERGIRPSFVFFDDCHEPSAKLGPQPLPVPAFHNSGWVTSPGVAVVDRFAESTETAEDTRRLKGYIQETMRRFANDDRVLLWELYNEPGCDQFYESSNNLLQKAWEWARAVPVSQPVCSTAQGSRGARNIAISRANSDVHSLHSYSGNEFMYKLIEDYRADGRPVMITEWLARGRDGTVFNNLPLMKAMNVAAINWGFVSGKSATVWPWSSRRRSGVRMWPNQLRERGFVTEDWEHLPEPDVWHHDLFRADGTPYDSAEIKLFRQLTGVEGR